MHALAKICRGTRRLIGILEFRRTNRGGCMRFSRVMTGMLIFLVGTSSLFAGDFILYGGLQNPGELTWSSAANVPGDLLNGGFGGTMGARFSTGRMIGFEQNISYSPRFAKQGVKSFQMDSNFLVQARERSSPMRPWVLDLSKPGATIFRGM